MITYLALSLLLSADPLPDLARFPSTDATRQAIVFHAARCEHLRHQADAEADPRRREKLLEKHGEAVEDLMAWLALRMAHGIPPKVGLPPPSAMRRQCAMRQLREAMGEEAWLAGKMP